MTVKIKYKLLFLLFSGLLFHSCVEPYDYQTEEYENVLVVQATLTDEFKHHEITLTRTYRLEEDSPSPERGAAVTVTNEQQQQLIFREITPGVYQSIDEFAVQPDLNYTLSITTADGKSYYSDPTHMIAGNQIDKVYAERAQLFGQDGVALLVTSRNPETASKFYRYEYEETYKIVSPYVVRNNLVSEDGSSYEIVPNTRNETVCYNTRESQKIIVSNSSGLSENTAGSFLVRYINAEDPILGQRYSILVKQYSLTPEAFTYYSTLDKISGSESLFSENQPGFVHGNMYSQEDESEKVVGFFGLSSVSIKRTFFNYVDFFQLDGSRPQFPKDCSIFRPGEFPETPIAMILSGNARYVSRSGAPSETELGIGPFRLIATGCVDCTLYGTNEVPEFWEE